MRAGKLNSRLIIERPEVTRDADTGAELVAWVEVATVWAAITPIVSIRGREAMMADQVQAAIDVKITIRWSPLVDPMTAKWRARLLTRYSPIIYNIAAPPAQVNMNGREIVMLCKSGTNEG
jgi:SPP1 family predicted phage head-tail adaptor